MDLKFHQRLAALADQQKEKLAVIGIGLGNDQEQMRKLANETGMNWPLSIAQKDSKVANDYHINLYGLFILGEMH